jgi:hypothetical protein
LERVTVRRCDASQCDMRCSDGVTVPEKCPIDAFHGNRSRTTASYARAPEARRGADHGRVSTQEIDFLRQRGYGARPDDRLSISQAVSSPIWAIPCWRPPPACRPGTEHLITRIASAGVCGTPRLPRFHGSYPQRFCWWQMQICNRQRPIHRLSGINHLDQIRPHGLVPYRPMADANDAK